METSWTEKYRPSNLEEMISQTEVVDLLKESVTQGTIPHLLFYGPPGVGKTSAILAVCNHLYGKKNVKNYVLELNASDERGISVVRGRIKKFAQYLPAESKDVKTKLKIVILDEADSMTQDAQNALRRVMEIYSSNTRFCIICNYVSKIIPAIVSRCSKFRFKSISSADMTERISYIARKESVNIDGDAIEELARISKGDLRSAITTLEISHKSMGADLITKGVVQEIAGVIDNSVIENYVLRCASASSVKELVAPTRWMINQGYEIFQILGKIFEYILRSGSVSDRAKGAVFRKIAEVEGKLNERADSFLQLLDLAVALNSIET